MKKFTILLFSLFVSCNHVYYVKPSYLPESSREKHEYLMDNFDIYVYNICESIGENINNNRFNDCPEDFFGMRESKNIQKVEEVYMLVHQTKDLVLYLTTFSHKYIRQDEKFLNDKSVYENKVILNQIDFAYIGTRNKEMNLIHFPDKHGNQDIILHYDNKVFPENLLIYEMNVATAENNYNINTPIQLSDVLKEKIVYRRNDHYKVYLHNNKGNDISCGDNKSPIEKIYIISKNGNTEVLFFPNTSDDMIFKIPNNKIKYLPAFSLL